MDKRNSNILPGLVEGEKKTTTGGKERDKAEMRGEGTGGTQWSTSQKRSGEGAKKGT